MKPFLKRPHYDLSLFIAACKKGLSKVYVPFVVAKEAEALGLTTTKDVLAFLVGDDISNFEHQNTEALNIWNGAPPPPLVDGYSFQTTKHDMYMAFYKNRESTKWVLKSLHVTQTYLNGNTEPDEASGDRDDA